MTDYDDDRLLARSSPSPTDEVVTHSFVRDIRLPRGKVARADHPRQRPRPHPAEHARPGDAASSSAATLDGLKARAAAGEIQAVAITGKPYILAAGADLSDMSARSRIARTTRS